MKRSQEKPGSSKKKSKEVYVPLGNANGSDNSSGLVTLGPGTSKALKKDPKDNKIPLIILDDSSESETETESPMELGDREDGGGSGFRATGAACNSENGDSDDELLEYDEEEEEYCGMDGIGDCDPDPLSSLERDNEVSCAGGSAKLSSALIPSITLSGDKIIGFMNSQIDDTISVLSIESPTITRILLNLFKWDKHALILKFFDSSHQQLNELTKSSLCLDKNSDFVLMSDGSRKTENVGDECMICFDSPGPNDYTLYGMACGHSFCEECWKSYLCTHIEENGFMGMGGVVHCPGFDCKVPINDGAILRYIGDAETGAAGVGIKKLFLRGISNTFVECDKKLQWCISPSCSNVIRIKDPDQLIGTNCPLVACSCGSQFCFTCGSAPHQPITCSMLAKWNSKNKDDSETDHWKLVNTKVCPKCGVSIEKNGGCNHMVCRKANCRHEFCWICLGDWSNHVYAGANGNCNRFQQESKSKEKTEADEALSLLKRYLHYYNLYRSHQQSLDAEANALENLNKKIETYIEAGVCSWADATFLKRAVEVLRACRLTLIHTFPFAYFIQPNNQQSIFEDNQTDLHNAVENLSFFLENTFAESVKISHLTEAIANGDVPGTINPERLAELSEGARAELQDLKTFIINKSTYCDQRREVLLRHIQEGYLSENNWWTYDL